jgi:hypothetical protein
VERLDVELSWNAIAEATVYQIYCGPIDPVSQLASGATALCGMTTDTSWSHPGALSGRKNYFYVVCATACSGMVSPDSGVIRKFTFLPIG